MKPNTILPSAKALAAALIGAWSLTACHRQEPIASLPDFEHNGDTLIIPQNSPLRLKLEFATARAESVQRTLTAPAVVEADPEKFARLFPPLTGHLLKLQVELGDDVAEGQPVATFESGDFASAQGDYLKAKSALALASKELGREQQLLQAKIAAEKEVEQAQNDFDNAESGLRSAAARLRSFGFDPEKEELGQPMRLFSPVSGKVVDISAAHREYHNDPTASLMTVADLSTVWVTASVEEKDLRFLHKDEPIQAELAAYPGESFHGRVLFIGDLIDPDTRTAKVRIAFSNPGNRLKPGMFATVQFLDFPATRVTVPTTALVQVGASTFVYVRSKPWELIPHSVHPGAQLGDRTVVEEGLESGATVVAKGGILLQ